MFKPIRAIVRSAFRRALLPGFALALVAAMWAVASYQIEVERRSARSQAVSHSEQLAHTLANHVRQTLRRVDHSSHLFKLKHEETGGVMPLAEFTRRGGLMDNVLPVQLALPVGRFGRDGTLLDSVNGSFAASVAQAPFFKALAQSDDGDVQYSIREGEGANWQIRVARPLRDQAGKFAGALEILIDPSYFVGDYDRLNLGERDTLILMTSASAHSARRVGDQVIMSDQLAFAPGSAADAGELLPRSRIDTVERIYCGVPMADVGLVAVVGLAQHAAMTSFEHHRLLYLRIALAASLLVLAVLALLKRQMRALRAQAAELAAVNDASPFGLVRSNRQGECIYANRKFESLTGRPAREALGDGWLESVEPDDRPLLRSAREHLQRSAAPFEAVVRFRHSGGAGGWASVKVVAIRIGAHVAGYVGTFDDITALRANVMALRESEARLRTIADTLPAMVAYVDAGQVLRFLNAAYERDLGADRAQLQGMPAREVLGAERHAQLLPYIERALGGETLTFEEQRADGAAERTLEVTYIPQRGQDGVTVIGFHVMRQDISSQKREKKRLLKLAQVDALTGLANRAGFLQKLDEAMRESAASGQLMGLMYLDVDRFKPVNDTHGHQVGDQLLKAFSARLAHTLRASDTIARLGGDEFTIIMENLARPADAAAIAAKVVAAMRLPFALDAVAVSVSTSIGVAYYHGDALEPNALMHQADMLLYQAKQAGRDTYRCAA